jgi:hypothetical protein
MTKTADGHDLSVGDEVWIRPNVLCPKEEPMQATVGSIYDFKIDFLEPDADGYIGAKLTAVFRERTNAFWTIEQLRKTGVFTRQELEELELE